MQVFSTCQAISSMLWGSHSAYAKCSNNLRVEELQGRAVQNHQELRLGQDFLSLLSWLKQPGASPTQELKQEADLNDVSLLCYAAAFTWLRLLMSNNAVDKCGIQDYSKKIYIFFFFHCNRTGIFGAKTSSHDNILFIVHPDHSCVFQWSVQITANLDSYV